MIGPEGPQAWRDECEPLGWLTTSPADLLACAERFDVGTPNHQIHDLIKQAVTDASGAGMLHALCGKIAQRTGVTEAALTGLALMIGRNLRLKPSDAPSLLARQFLTSVFADGAHLVTTARGEMYGYDGSMWRALPPLELERLLLELVLMGSHPFNRDFRHPMARAVMRMIKTLQTGPAPWDLGPGPNCVINTLSGELWIEDGGGVQMRPHRPSSGLRAIAPIHYDPDAACPRFDQAMVEIFSKSSDPSEMVRHVLEVMGYAIQPRRDFAAIVCLVGGGANGKTSLLSLLQTLVGADQVYAGSGGALNDRFTLPNLAGRLLYVDDDLSEGARLNDGLLKQMSEDKLMTARRAHASGSVTFRASALPILAMNGAPKINDSSYGLLRRLLVIPFDRRFEAHDQDPGLVEHIRRHELPGVLNRCLEGLQRLRARGRFDEPTDCLLAKAEWIETANPLLGFLADACRAAPGRRVSLGDLHAAMAAWCRVERQPMRLTRKALARQLRSAGYKVEKVAGLARVMGVALTSRDSPRPRPNRRHSSGPSAQLGRLAQGPQL